MGEAHFFGNQPRVKNIREVKRKASTQYILTAAHACLDWRI